MKDENGFIKRDPAVEAAINGGNARQAERSMPMKDRKRVKRERAKAESRKGARALYDLPPAMIKEIQMVAAEYETTASQIAKLALWMFLNAVRDRDVDIRAYRVLANKNPKCPYKIELPNE